MAQNLHKPPAARIIYAVSECLCYTESRQREEMHIGKNERVVSALDIYIFSSAGVCS